MFYKSFNTFLLLMEIHSIHLSLQDLLIKFVWKTIDSILSKPFNISILKSYRLLVYKRKSLNNIVDP